MILAAILATGAMAAVQDKPIVLERVFKKGEAATYKVLSNLQVETRQAGLETFMPAPDTDISYSFTYEVTELKGDGIAVLHYKRPTVTERTGEGSTTAARTDVVKTNFDLMLTVSPINEIIDMKDLTKKKKPEKKKGGLVMGAFAGMSPNAQISIGSFISEIHRLALFLGSLDSAVDFSPKLPFDEIKPGDTWQKTVGYSPQRLKDKEGKSAVQRLDYTYTYKGIVQSGAKKVYRINAALNVDTDAAEFVNQLIGMKPEQSGLKEIRLKLAANIDYDLDLNTRRTLKAVATSNGGVKILVTQMPNEPVMEQNIKGKTTLSLVKG
jgi:hypothetical protein